MFPTVNGWFIGLSFLGSFLQEAVQAVDSAIHAVVCLRCRIITKVLKPTCTGENPSVGFTVEKSFPF